MVEICYGELVSLICLVSWQNKLDSGSECNFLFKTVRVGYTWNVELGNIDNSCVRTFYESLINAEPGLKVHLILKACMK